MNLFSELREGFGISWDALRAHKLRSALTTLGIVIGIVTVTLMAAAITGLDRAFIQSISSLGADVFYIQRNSWINENTEDSWLKSQKRPPIRPVDAEALAGRFALATIAPVANGGGNTVKYKDRSASSVFIIGTTQEYQDTSGVGVAQGRFLTAADAEGGRPVCVIGSEVATNLFRTESPLGGRIKIADQSYEVVGVLEKQGIMLGWSLDNRIIVPLSKFLTEIRNRSSIEIHVKAKGGAELDEVREELRQAMRQVRHLAPNQPDDFAINQQDQIVEMFHRVTGRIAIIGLCVTSLSLFVGGIGIMNILFVSVAERTREIGIRKAIGAKRRTILLQFLIEAACICVLGGVIGLAISGLATLAVKHILPTSLSFNIVVMALVVSLLTGLISGFLPAWRAARMNPVDALRNE